MGRNTPMHYNHVGKYVLDFSNGCIFCFIFFYEVYSTSLILEYDNLVILGCNELILHRHTYVLWTFSVSSSVFPNTAFHAVYDLELPVHFFFSNVMF